MSRGRHSALLSWPLRTEIHVTLPPNYDTLMDCQHNYNTKLFGSLRFSCVWLLLSCVWNLCFSSAFSNKIWGFLTKTKPMLHITPELAAVHWPPVSLKYRGLHVQEVLWPLSTGRSLHIFRAGTCSKVKEGVFPVYYSPTFLFISL